jgi:hypothetical protein
MALAHGCPKEPVSEDLELAATKYAKDKYMPVQTSQAFKAGAQWQKQRDNIPQELVEAYWNAVNTGVKGTCDIINAINGFNKSETSSDAKKLGDEIARRWNECNDKQ